MNIDDDTYLNNENLSVFLKGLDMRFPKLAKPRYVGSPGYGTSTHYNGRALDIPTDS
jgi:hypothetical protein